MTQVGRDRLAVLLAGVSGSLDAIGFVALGGAFTSVMTGNLVLSGVAVAHADGRLLLRVTAAILLYVVGCAFGARLVGEASSKGSPEYWPAAVTRTLAVEAGLIMVFAATWWSADDHPSAGLQLLCLLANAAALGMQSAAVQRFGVTGLSTTYLTGTLTTLVLRLAHGRPLAHVALHGQLLIGLVAGGASGAALALYARPAAPLLPLVLMVSVLIAGTRLHTEHPVDA